MAAETVSLQDLHRDLSFLLQKVSKIELSIAEISEDLHQVRPEYLEKLEKIKKGKIHHFENKEDFLHFLKHEV